MHGEAPKDNHDSFNGALNYHGGPSAAATPLQTIMIVLLTSLCDMIYFHPTM